MPYGWEGNRGSVVGLTMRHTLKWFITGSVNTGDEYAANTLREVSPPRYGSGVL